MMGNVYNAEFFSYLHEHGYYPEYLSRDEICDLYIRYLSENTSFTEEQIYYSLVNDDSNFCDFVFDDGEIVSFHRINSDWSEVRDGYRYYFENGYFYKYDINHNKEILSLDEINTIFGTVKNINGEDVFVPADFRVNDTELFVPSNDISLLKESAFGQIYSSVISGQNVIGDDGNYYYTISKQAAVDFMRHYMSMGNVTVPINDNPGYERITHTYTPQQIMTMSEYQLLNLWNRSSYGNTVKMSTTGGNYVLSCTHDQSSLLGPLILSTDYYFPKNDENFINSMLANLYNNSLGIPAFSVNPDDVSKNPGCIFSDNGIVLSFENYTDNVEKFMDQDFTLSYNGYTITTNYQLFIEAGYDPVEYISNFLMSDDYVNYVDLGLVTSLRMDTSIDEYRLNASNCYSNIELMDNDVYRIYFQNGQFVDINKSDYDEVFNCSIAAIDDELCNSDAYFSNVVEHHFQSVMPNAVIDVRPIDGDNFIVIINGKEKRYSLNTLKRMLGDTELSDIDLNYYDNVLIEKNLDSIKQYIMAKYSMTGSEYIEVVYNPITNKCQVIVDGAKFPLTEADDYEIAKFIIDETGIDSRTVEKVNNSTYNNTGNKYIPTEIFIPCITIDDVNVYRNFVKNIKEFEYDKLGLSYFGLYNDLRFFGGNYSVNKLKKLSSNSMLLKSLVENLGKQIEDCLVMLENTDISIKVKLDEWIDEFFEVSSLGYVGGIDLSEADNGSSVAFWKKKSEEASFYADEMALIRQGYILIPDEYRLKMYDAGFGDFKTLTINGVINYYVSGTNLEKYITNETGSKFEFTDDYTLFDYASEMLNLNDPNHLVDSLNNGTMTNEENLCLSIFNTMGQILNVEENLRLENSFRAVGNMSELYDVILSDKYNEYYEKYKDYVEEEKKFGYYTFSHDDSLTYGMNVLKYMVYDIAIKQLNDLDKRYVELLAKKNSNKLASAEYGDIVLSDEEIAAIDKELELIDKEVEKLSYNHELYYKIWEETYERNVDKYIPYCYNQVKGYEYAVKYLEGKLTDLEITAEEIAGYTAACFADGFLSPFSGIIGLLEPELSPNDYAKKYLGEMMISDNFDMDVVNNKYEKGLISQAERDLKEAVFKQLNTSIGLDVMKEYGAVGRVAGESVMEILLEAGLIATGLGGAKRCKKIAKLAKDFFVVSGKSRGKYVDNVWKGYDETQATVMALAYFTGNFTFRALLDWGIGKLKFGKLEYDPRKGSFKIVDDGVKKLSKYTDDVVELTERIDGLTILDDLPTQDVIKLAQQLNDAKLYRNIAGVYSSAMPLLNFGFELGAASTDVNAGDWIDKASVNVVRMLYGEKLSDKDWELDVHNDKAEDYTGVVIKAGKSTVDAYCKILPLLLIGK